MNVRHAALVTALAAVLAAGIWTAPAFAHYIPSYAQDPVYVLTPATKICPESTQTVTAERLRGNPDGRVDEWGVLEDTFQIRVQLTHAGGPSTGGETVDTGVTVTWK